MQKLWAPQGKDKHVVSIIMSAIRNYALEQSEHEICNNKMLHGFVTEYKTNPLGVDCWGNTELRHLPDIASGASADAIQQSLRTVAWPHQLLISINACLGKPGKPNADSRIIRKKKIYRATVSNRNNVKQWSIDSKDSFDSSAKGGSALYAALYRNLFAEIAHWLGEAPIAIFNDYYKFFDTIDIKILLQKCNEHDFPLIDSAILLQQHLAPRVIQANGLLSLAMEVSNSILAGCGYSWDLTRALQIDLLSNINNTHSHANIKSFIDDISMFAKGKMDHYVLQVLIPAEITFGEGVKKLGLTLSPEGNIVGSTTRIIQSFLKEIKTLTKDNIIVVPIRSARDVGVCFTAGKARPKDIINNRLKNNKTHI